MKIYSGGLGILAGDYLKEASDSNVDMCGVGFLYRYGYFKQSLSMDGQQIANYEVQNFGNLPLERVRDEKGSPLVLDVPYLDYYVHAYVWRINVGRVPLYLLDTDNEMNSEFDRPITYQLYGGDWENRLKQAIFARLQTENKSKIMSLYRSGNKEELAILRDTLIGKVELEAESRKMEAKISPEVREAYKTVGGVPFLDNEYTVYGEVVDGLDVVDAIQAMKTNKQDRPTENVVILSVEVI